ncbi:MAG: response regulator [Candidatus Promineifilaceae bacterium]
MSKRILYVEDNYNNMLLMKRIVEAEGHELLTSVDGEGGWSIASEEIPDLIFVDLRLPGDMDGFELLQRIKSDFDLQHIPVVVLTAGGSSDAEEQARGYSCDGFLQKPADIREIRALIRKYLGQDRTAY